MRRLAGDRQRCLPLPLWCHAHEHPNLLNGKHGVIFHRSRTFLRLVAVPRGW
ncbi:hypothetical protein EDWATA_03390 [Edwardsiella tarda ATCC 23685]|uniref:Uncharacterized protein n=1 Tax=Edwardsiella tarda ATCC 23685 TaxID=500638 RepID=D4F9D2_EDWTA|nr:hypothetical protein EDWATA_03390 [Edwardsiella tarda ATCC 23685]